MLSTQQAELQSHVDRLVEKHGNQRDALLPILEDVQLRYSAISDATMQIVADRLGIHPVEVFSVATFYSLLNEQPRGRFVVRLCRTLSCDMANKGAVARQLEKDLGIRFGETTADGRFALEWASCIGMCDQGPALLVNDQVFTRVTAQRVHEILTACTESFGPHAAAKRERSNQ